MIFHVRGMGMVVFGWKLLPLATLSKRKYKRWPKVSAHSTDIFCFRGCDVPPIILTWLIIRKVHFAILVYLNYYFILFWWWFHTVLKTSRQRFPPECSSFRFPSLLLSRLSLIIGVRHNTFEWIRLRHGLIPCNEMESVDDLSAAEEDCVCVSE